MADTVIQSTSQINDEIISEQSLSSILDRSLELFGVVDENDSSSEKYKAAVIQGISQLEEATRMVNMLSLFSRNESIDEVATVDLKYLLLPALLGSFTVKKSSTGPAERKQILLLSELYFEDYLRRYKDYEISDSSNEDDQTLPKAAVIHGSCTVPIGNVYSITISQGARDRDQKIAQFKRLKALHEREKELCSNMKNNKDDEVAREYFTVLLKKWALTASEELENIKLEKGILEHLSSSVPGKNVSTKEKPKPLKPVIITRNELQKQVYGSGYPSLPVMTVDEFYQQRYPENAARGPPAASEMNNLMYIAANPDIHKEELEQEEEEQERKIENDDPELLQHTRAFDDWKDVNRRGCGSRKNKG